VTSTTDRWAEAEAAVDRGTPWRFREPDAPNPLTIEVTGWSTGHTTLGEAEFLNGTDHTGKAWSILVGSVVLTKRLIEGLVEEWDEGSQQFVVVKTLGRVEAGEMVSIKFIGDKQGAKYDYPNFRVYRKQYDEVDSGGGNGLPSIPTRQATPEEQAEFDAKYGDMAEADFEVPVRNSQNADPGEDGIPYA
jgi:hypothetical protein